MDHPVNDASPTPAGQSQPPAHGSATGPDSELFVLEKIFSFDPHSREFRSRWEGWSPDDDTMEPPGHLEFNTVKRLFNLRKETHSGRYPSKLSWSLTQVTHRLSLIVIISYLIQKQVLMAYLS